MHMLQPGVSTFSIFNACSLLQHKPRNGSCSPLDLHASVLSSRLVRSIFELLLDSDSVLPGRSVGKNKENRRVMACWQGGVSSLSTLAVFKCFDVTLTNQQRKQRLPWYAAGSCRHLHGHSSIITQLTKVALTNQYLLPPLMDPWLGNCCMCIIGC